MNAKTLSAITGILTLAIALFSFTLSFNALTDLAAKHGVSIPALFPLVVEAGVVVFSLNALYRSIHGESAKWQWAMIILSSLLAGLFNVLHSEPDLISRVISSMPSLFLLLSFETFLGQAKHIVKTKASVKSLSDLAQEIDDKRRELEKTTADKTAELDRLVTEKQVEIEQHQAELDKLTGQIQQATAKLESLKNDIKAGQIETNHRSVTELNDAKQAKITQRQADVLSLLQEGVSPDDISSRLNVSLRTVQRDISTLNGQVRVSQ